MNQSIEKAETFINVVGLIGLIACLFIVATAPWMAKHWFSYQTTVAYEVKEPYQYTVCTISTFECYTTTYGSCYHAEDCESLWNSSYKTTLYQALKEGYQPCSKCTPTVRTTFEETETRYKTVTQTETITEEPAFLVGLIGCISVSTICFIIMIPALIKIKRQKTEPL